MSKDASSENFRLSSEELDALRMEAQSVSPERQREFEAIVDEAYTLFITKFQKLFSQREMIPKVEMKKRFVLIDSETMRAFAASWQSDSIAEKDSEEVTQLMVVESLSTFAERNKINLSEFTEADLKQWLSELPSNKQRQFENYFKTRSKVEGSSYLPEDEVGTFRAYNREGNFVIGMPIEVWEGLSEQNKTALIQKEGSLEKARKFVEKAAWLNIALHEICHLYQDDKDESLPLWLKELQAYWIGRELVPMDLQFHRSDFDARADEYQALLDKYPDLHSCLLDLNRGKNLATVQSAKNDVTNERIMELFPDYKSGSTT
jgi:hypothetical protein